jgi:hypothetical protein
MVNLDAFIVMVAAPSSVLPGWIDAPRDGMRRLLERRAVIG